VSAASPQEHPPALFEICGADSGEMMLQLWEKRERLLRPSTLAQNEPGKSSHPNAAATAQIEERSPPSPAPRSAYAFFPQLAHTGKLSAAASGMPNDIMQRIIHLGVCAADTPWVR
jgi:hypothetical protein